MTDRVIFRGGLPSGEVGLAVRGFEPAALKSKRPDLATQIGQHRKT